MAGNFNTRRSGASALILFVTAVAHLLAFYSWRLMVLRPSSGSDVSSPLSIELIILPPDRQQFAESRPQVSANPEKPPSVKIKPSAIAPAPPQAITITSEPNARLIDLDPAPSIPDAARMATDQMIMNAKRDVGKIDRDLRKATPKFPEPIPNSVQARLEKNIAAAGKHAWGDSQEKVLADGRKITKYYGVGGAYCVSTDGAGSTNGMDQIQGGARTRVTNCGSLFD